MDTYNKVELEKKCIALIGDGNICKHFYLEFQSRLNIKYFIISNIDDLNENIKRFFENCAMNIIPLKKQYFEEHNILLVLCKEHKLRGIYDKLFFQNSIEWGIDYIDYSYVVQYYRYKDNMRLEEKKIWIFGAGDNGKKFYERYRDIYNISGFLSNFTVEQEVYGLPVIRPDSILKQNNIYIVVCSDADILMSEQIAEMGIEGGKGYCFPEMMPQKLFIAIGTCQIIKIADTLRYNRYFVGNYHINTYFENIYNICSHADEERIKAYGKFCDIVFYNKTNAGMTELRNYDPVINQYYKNSISLFLPFYYFKGQIIQSTDTANDYTINLQSGIGVWFRGDQEINHMIENDVSVEEIIKRITNDHYWSKEKIVKNFNQELKKIEVLDRFSSFPIKNFIEKNYKKDLIFIDGTHFGHGLCLYLANEIAKFLHIQPITDPKEIDECIHAHAYTSIMPVYPCVRKALEMEIEDVCQFYNIEKKTVETLNIEEFISRYVQYVINIRDIYGKYGTIMAW